MPPQASIRIMANCLRYTVDHNCHRLCLKAECRRSPSHGLVRIMSSSYLKLVERWTKEYPRAHAALASSPKAPDNSAHDGMMRFIQLLSRSPRPAPISSLYRIHDARLLLPAAKAQLLEGCPPTRSNGHRVIHTSDVHDLHGDRHPRGTPTQQPIPIPWSR